MTSINELGFNNENIEIQLKAFFKKASKQDIVNFSNNIFNKVMYILWLCPHFVSTINFYKSLIKSFFVSPTALAVWQNDCRPF